MPCPTCDHTMNKITQGEGVAYFHCPRCGTITCNSLGVVDVIEVPKLVHRCRVYQRSLDAKHLIEWNRIGINEAINIPEKRSNAG